MNTTNTTPTHPASASHRQEAESDKFLCTAQNGPSSDPPRQCVKGHDGGCQVNAGANQQVVGRRRVEEGTGTRILHPCWHTRLPPLRIANHLAHEL